jgi:hypothetical protein
MANTSSGTWQENSVPPIKLVRWEVIGSNEPNCDSKHYFAGWVDALGESRVTSAIVSYDTAHKIGISSSGKAYKLEGDSGRERPDAAVTAVINHWAAINGKGLDEVPDLTEQYE